MTAQSMAATIRDLRAANGTLGKPQPVEPAAEAATDAALVRVEAER